MSDNNAQTLFNACSLATNVLSERHEGSIIEYSSPTRNVVLTTLEDKLTHHDVTADILKFCTNLYVGYYLQAVSLMNNIGNVNVRRVLDRLNTKRDVVGNAKDKAEEWIAIESFCQYPTFIKQYPVTFFGDRNRYSLEDKMQNIKDALNGNDGSHHSGSDRRGDKAGSLANQDTQKILNDVPNLAQGKIFEVVIENEGKRAVIPAMVQLNPIACNREMFVAMYAQANQNNTMVNRFRRWLDGELTTIGDMLFCNDIIAERARLLKQDKHGITKQLEAKRRSNRLSALITQKTSLATASTISVISKESIQAIELAVGGKIDNAKVRDDIFARSGLIMLIVVDEMYEMVTMYHRGQNHKMELTFSECKTAAKGNGPNVMEILKAFQAGQVPNI